MNIPMKHNSFSLFLDILYDLLNIGWIHCHIENTKIGDDHYIIVAVCEYLQ